MRTLNACTIEMSIPKASAVSARDSGLPEPRQRRDEEEINQARRARKQLMPACIAAKTLPKREAGRGT
jgi:hypothetical protein